MVFLESLAGQVKSFAATVAAGAAAGFCYDYYRAVRKAFRLKKAGSLLGDALFWLAVTAVVFLMLLWGNWGEVRLYVFIGLGLGALAYFRLLGSTARRLMHYKFFLLFKAWKLLTRAVLLLWAATLFPFRLLALILSYPLKCLRGPSVKARSRLKSAFHRVAAKGAGPAGRLKARFSRLAFWKRNKQI
ncbi:MAG: spore cortex biosynthesis protein YabQ [Pelotomaculum sp.]|nr:spore cortex biosynthesis protein YabQ [Pelotomaculum sp.]